MSEENVQIVKRGYEALQANDIEAFLNYVDPEVEWRSLIMEVEGVFHGRDGVREWWDGIRSVFPDWNPSIVGVRDLGDWVVVHARGIGSGATSGVGLDNHFWQALKVRNGLVVRYGAFRTEAEALEAAGLSE
jgi:ketosteroid isomerase-like protein